MKYKPLENNQLYGISVLLQWTRITLRHVILLEAPRKVLLLVTT